MKSQLLGGVKNSQISNSKQANCGKCKLAHYKCFNVSIRILQKISTHSSAPSYTSTRTPSVQSHTRMLRQDGIEEKETQSVSTLFLSILLPILSAMCIVLVYMCANSKKSYVCLLSRGYSPCILRFFKKRGFLRTQILPTVESSGVSQATTYSQTSMKQRHSHESFDSPA